MEAEELIAEDEKWARTVIELAHHAFATEDPTERRKRTNDCYDYFVSFSLSESISDQPTS